MDQHKFLYLRHNLRAVYGRSQVYIYIYFNLFLRGTHLVHTKQQFGHCCGVQRSILKPVLTSYLDIFRTIYTADK